LTRSPLRGLLSPRKYFFPQQNEDLVHFRRRKRFLFLFRLLLFRGCLSTLIARKLKDPRPSPSPASAAPPRDIAHSSTNVFLIGPLGGNSSFDPFSVLFAAFFSRGKLIHLLLFLKTFLFSTGPFFPGHSFFLLKNVPVDRLSLLRFFGRPNLLFLLLVYSFLSRKVSPAACRASFPLTRPEQAAMSCSLPIVIIVPYLPRTLIFLLLRGQFSP